MMDPSFHQVVQAIDQADIEEVQRHRLMLLAIGRRYLDAGDGLTPHGVEALDHYVTMVARSAIGEADCLTYADILALVEATG
jgi:hypothetical protein